MPPTPRASTAARGYGAHHQRLRAAWEPRVRIGVVHCWRCGERILPSEPWDLGHDDHDRSIYRGPEHQACNRSGRPRTTAPAAAAPAVGAGGYDRRQAPAPYGMGACGCCPRPIPWQHRRDADSSAIVPVQLD